MADTTRRVVLQLIAQNKARAELAGFQRDMKRTANTVTRMARTSLAVFGIGGGIYAVKRALGAVTEAVIVQEKAEIDLAAAIGETNNRHSRAVASLKAYAAAMQRLTVHGDEEILSQMAYAANLGVTKDRLEKATTAAIGLAAKYRIDLRSAMMLVGRASQGQTQMLTRYGIVLDQTLSNEEKFNRLLEIGAGAFGLATAETKSAEGAMKQLSNIWGDFKEDIGPGVIDVIKDINKWVKSNREEIEATAKALGWYAKVLAEAGAEIASGFKSTRTVLSGARSSDASTQGLGNLGSGSAGLVAMARSGKKSDALPVGKLDIPPARAQVLADMRAQARAIREGVFDYTGPLPGTEYKVDPAEQVKKTIAQTDELLKKMQREVELAKMGGAERAQSLAIDKYREAIQRDIEVGLDRAVDLTEAETEAVKKLALEHYNVAEQGRKATVDITAAYVRMYDSIDSRTVASYDARRKLIEQEFAEYEKLLGKTAELERAKQEALTQMAVQQAKDSNDPLLGISAAVYDLKKEVGGLGQLFYNLTKQGVNGFTDALTDAVFEAEDLGDALRDVGREMAKTAFRFGVQNATLGVLTGLGFGSFGGAGAAMGSAGGAAAVAHRGGIMGVTPMPSRMVPASMFAGAPRLHDGLASDEFPAILQRGEQVHTKGQAAASKMSGAQIESLLGHILAALRQRQQLNATIVDSRDVVTRSQMEGRDGEQLIMHHVGRNQ